MTRLITAILGLAVLPGASLGQEDRQMKTDGAEAVDERTVADIDTAALSDGHLILVPAGTFTMGDGSAHCGEEEREVTLTRDFYLGQHEVTNREYLEAVQWAYTREFVTATTSSVLDNLDGSTVGLLDLDDPACEIAFSGDVFSLRDAGHGISPDHPVRFVTWYGAARYCDWLSLQAGLPQAYAHSGDWSCNGGDPYGAQGYRLPTDAEWEYAAQYNDERIYPWGNTEPWGSLVNYRGRVGRTSPVGSYPAGNSALGLFDMAGNLLEWCNDWYVCDLGTDPVTDPLGPRDPPDWGTLGNPRAFRGGSWYCGDSLLRCASRLGWPTSSSNHRTGFRVARTASP